MSVLETLSDSWRHFVASLAPPSRRNAAGGLVIGGPRTQATWPNYGLDGQVERAYKLAVVAACIDAIARDVSAAPLKVYRKVDGQPEEEPQHPARLVVHAPNPAMSESEFWYFVVAMAASTGFCVIEKVRSGAGRPVQLWPLVSPWLKVRPRPQQMPEWEYRVPGNDPWVLAAENVILVTYRPDPWGGWTGRSPLTSLKRQLAISDQMTDFLAVLFENGGVPPIGLRVLPQDGIIPKLDEGERETILESFAQKYGGARNWHKPAFLGGLEVTRIGLDLGELLWPDIRDRIETDVCIAFGLPSGFVGTLAGLQRNTFSNYENSTRQYYDGTVAPLWSRLDGAFTRGLLVEFDPGLTREFAFDVSEITALQEDETPKWDRAIRGVASGMLTLDDGRSQVGLPPFEGGAGDVLLIPFSASITRPADLAILAGQTAEPPQPVPAALAPFAEPDEGDEPEAPEDEEERALRFTVRADRGYRADRQTRAAIHTRSKKAIAKLSRVGAQRLRAFWRAQGKRIAEEATRSAVPEQRALENIDWQAEERALADVLTRFYALNGETAFAEVADLLKVDVAWDLANPNVKHLMAELGQRIGGISETTRLDVSRVVTEALDEGVSLHELSERLTGLFEETYRGRAMAVGRTESQVAYNSASLTGYAETGQVSQVEMLDNRAHGGYGGDGDGLTCEERDGMVVDFGQAQMSVQGTHPNCILALSPILPMPLGDA